MQQAETTAGKGDNPEVAYCNTNLRQRMKIRATMVGTRFFGDAGKKQENKAWRNRAALARELLGVAESTWKSDRTAIV
mgnify:CR=1 FL=1